MESQQIEQLVELYVNQKLSLGEIGKRFGLSAQLTRYYLTKAGIKGRSIKEALKIRKAKPSYTPWNIYPIKRGKSCQ